MLTEIWDLFLASTLHLLCERGSPDTAGPKILSDCYVTDWLFVSPYRDIIVPRVLTCSSCTPKPSLNNVDKNMGPFFSRNSLVAGERVLIYDCGYNYCRLFFSRLFVSYFPCEFLVLADYLFGLGFLLLGWSCEFVGVKFELTCGRYFWPFNVHVCDLFEWSLIFDVGMKFDFDVGLKFDFCWGEVWVCRIEVWFVQI